MFPISKVLVRILVVEFYTRNAGQFLFIFFIMFGMVEGSQLLNYHLSLIIGVINSTLFYLGVLAVWLLYGIKSLQFVTSQLAKPEHSFFYALASLPPATQVLLFFIVHLLIQQPVWIYALAIVGVAFAQHNWFIGTEILVFNITLCFLLSIITVYKLNNPSSNAYTSFLKTPSFLKQSLAWFYGAFILNELKIILLVTKLFSYFALYGFLQIRVDHYENRIALMGLLVGLAANSVLIFELRKWEDSYLLFIKNLPLTSVKRYLTMATVFALLLLPELFLLITHNIQFMDILGNLLFSISFQLLLFALVHHLKMDMDKYIQYLLIIFLGSFGLILFKLYIPVTIASLFCSYFLYQKYFYTYEAQRL